MRRDLPAGAQLAQAVHAGIQFGQTHPGITERWFQDSNYLVVVSAEDELELMELAQKANQYGIAYDVVREPDFDDQVTAIAFEPGSIARKICSGLPLALRERKTDLQLETVGVSPAGVSTNVPSGPDHLRKGWW